MARRRRRPNESYSNIIIKAIRNSPLQRLKLSEIYDYVIREIPHMNGNDKGWQNTVRHNLSHNKCFKRILIKDLSPILSGSCEEDEEVSLSGRGKGSKQQPGKKGKGGYWVLVPEKLEESMSSSRPKKSSVDQGRLAPSPKRLHQQQEPRSMNMMSSMQNTDAQGLGFQQQQQYQQPRYFQRPRYDFALSSVSPHSAPSRGSSSVPWHQHQQHQQLSQGRRKSSLIDIDRDVASMTIAEQPSRYAPQHMHSTSSTPHHHHHQLHHQEAFYHQDHPSCENHDIEHYSFGYAPTSLSAAGERSEVENQERRRSSIGSGSHSPTHTSGGGDNEMSSGSDDLQSGRSDNSSSHIGNTGSDFDDLEDEELTPGGCGSGDATDLVAMEIDGSPSSSADVVVSGGRLSDSEAERMNIQEEDDNDTYVGTESKTIEDNSDTVFNLSSSPSSPSILGSGRGRGMSIQDILN
ncbi:Forkhead box protein G1 [Gryganskiella cystojenkinii]|nr:Forkhead box protein G1 [Gryganskiella cystojenkinii]